MKTLQVTVTKTYQSATKQPDENVIDTWKKSFSGKKADKDCENYLQALHDEKMSNACIAAGLGAYTLSKITSLSNWDNRRWCDERTQKAPQFKAVTKQIHYSLS